MRNVKTISVARFAGNVAIITRALVGCSDHPYDPNAPAIDPNAPKVHITSPVLGTVAGDVKTVTVSGTSSDDVGVVSVTVNDKAASLAPDGSWTVDVPVVPGTNLLHAVATDASSNQGKESRAVVAGPMQDLAMKVPNALTATLSAATFAAIGKGASNYLHTTDLEALVAPLNPVVDSGTTNGQPDCLYAQAFITSISMGDATTFSLVPETGGLWLDAELDQVNVGMHLQYAAACIDGSRDITIAASHIKVQGNLDVGITAGNWDIQLANPNVTLTGFDLELGGLSGEIVDLLDLNAAFGPIIGWATEKFVVPMLATSLDGLNNVKTVAVLDTMVDILVKPAKIDFSQQGAIVELDTTLRAHGDSGQYVYVPNTVPAMNLSQGFQLAVADDTANQLMTSLWSAKALDKTIPLANGPYGDVGKLYDSVELSAAAPPFVDASGNNGLVLTVGDLMATFRDGASVTTEIAINAQVDIKVTKGTDGLMRFDVGQPTVYVDVLDQGVDGANQLDNAQFEAISSFALSRIIAVGSGSIGAIPLPSVGGVSLANVTIDAQAGYLIVDGDVQ